MSIANTLGTATGNTAAYGKHYTVSAGINSTGFVAEFVASTIAAYAAKDAELLERRNEMRALRASGPALAAPKVTRQKKLAA